MSERECYGDGAPEFRPGRSSRTGRRSGVILPSPGCSSPGRQDSETGPMETVKAGPRRSSIIKDSSVSKVGGGRKKTVSFSSTPSERKVSSVVDCLAFMQCGCELRKVRPNARVYCRFYTLDLEQACLRWEPSKKDAEHARLDVAAIREVRAGKSTDTFRNHGPADQLAQEAAFSIIHGPDCRSLDLVALSADAANIWVTGLRHLLSRPAGAGGGAGGGAEDGSLGSRMRRGWLAEEFGKVDEDGHGVVSEDVAVATICKLCPSIKEAKVRLRFKEIQQRKEKLTSHVTLEEFHEAYCELCTRPDVYFLLVQLSKSRECLDAQDLRLFLEVEQWAGKGAGHGAGPSAAEASQDILRRFEPSVTGREQGLLGLDGFTRYLQAPESQLMAPRHQSVWQDMSLPLTRYYISAAAPSSFLQGAPGALEQVLRAGCRYLELGVSDGPKGEPLLDPSTAAVTLRSALEAVRDHAFLTTPFPLLIYLRQHCCPAQQHVLAQHLRQVFGDRLYKPEAPPTGESDVLLPSPQQLRGRVLLAGKKLPPWQEGEVGEVSNDEEEVSVVDKQAVDVAEGGEVGVAEAEEGVVKGEAPKLHLCRELSDLVALADAGSLAFFEAQRRGGSPQTRPSPWTLCSLGRSEAGRLASEAAEGLAATTGRMLTRVRLGPAGPDCANPDPQAYWTSGCQLVPLNLQAPGVSLDLHRARFAQNGGCGFSLRPAPSATAATPPQDLRVRVIGAHSLPKPQGSGTIGEVIDPYVVLELHGVPADCAEHRTRTAAQNQDDPLFDQTFHFQVSVPELALLRFVVLDDDYIGDDFIGQYSVGLQCLQCGYRTVPLLSFSGEPLPRASLFVHVTITSRQGGDGGGAQRKAGRGRILRHVGIRTLDHVLRPAAAPLKEAADLREGVKNAVEGFKEQCGLSPVAELKKCIQSLASRLQSADGAPGANLALRDGYPYLEAQGYLPESSYKLLTAYEKVVTALRLLIENADGVQGRIGQVHRHGVELQDDLPRLGEEEGLKGRILNKAVESFTWNLTVLKGQCDLLRIAKANALDTLRQLTLGCEACGLTSTAK
ncbi:inactive phospholipase C-like protein 1 [Anguilla rostrata]|uniref:inactive phospholipase C-like protein 1 n=1 Tax=Anguilla rostrata TaxID=7938 RepID=UPI0030D5F33C